MYVDKQINLMAMALRNCSGHCSRKIQISLLPKHWAHFWSAANEGICLETIPLCAYSHTWVILPVLSLGIFKFATTAIWLLFVSRFCRCSLCNDLSKIRCETRRHETFRLSLFRNDKKAGDVNYAYTYSTVEKICVHAGFVNLLPKNTCTRTMPDAITNARSSAIVESKT